MFEKTPDSGGYPSSYYTYTNEDKRSIKCMVLRIMVPTSIKLGEWDKYTSRRITSTRVFTQKIMGDAMNPMS